MDFIPPPYDSKIGPLEIPFSADTVLDFQVGLDDFWERRGNPPLRAFCESHPRAASWLQSWLYFGLLSAILDNQLSLNELYTVGERWPRIVSSVGISKILSIIYTRLPREDYPSYQPNLSWLPLIPEAIEVMDTIEPWLDDTELLMLTALSIRNLLSALGSLLQHFISDSRIWSIPSAVTIMPDKSLPDRGASLYLSLKMRENGWCNHQIYRIFRSFPYHIVYYFSRLSRHTEKISHNNCTESKCVGWTVDSSSFKTNHRDSGCSCQDIQVSSTKVASIIRKGAIPIISLRRNKQGNLSIKLHQWNGRTSYIAISHVWADGLGNPSANALPSCQADRLLFLLELSRAQTKSWGSTAYFWMDTFCIPISNGHIEDINHIKHVAIQSMNTIYASAAATLVVDSELQRIPQCADLPTLLAFIFACGWGTRGWTLQEGNLSKICLFALFDGVVNLKAKIESARTFQSILTEELAINWLEGDLGIWKTSLFAGLGRSHRMTHQFVKAWNSLLDRATGQSKDISAVLANLLGFSAYRVLQVPDTASQVGILLNSLKYLPLSLFYNKGSRQVVLDNRTQEIPLTQILAEPQRERVERHRRRYHWKSENSAYADEEGALVPLEEYPEGDTRSGHLGYGFKNGWLPSAIAGDILDTRSLLLRAGNTLISTHKHSETVLITTKLTRFHRSFELINRACPSQRYHIETVRDEGQSQLDTVVTTHAPRAYCFILNYPCYAIRKQEALPINGAQFVILKEKDDVVSCIFDCPIRISHVFRSKGVAQLYARPYHHDISIEIDDLGPVLPCPKSPPSALFTIFLYSIVLFYTGVTLYFNLSLSANLDQKSRVIARLIVPEAPLYLISACIFRSSSECRLFLAGLYDKPPNTRKTVRLIKGATYYFDCFIVSSTACVLFCGSFALTNIIFFLEVHKSNSNYQSTPFSVGWMIPLVILSILTVVFGIMRS